MKKVAIVQSNYIPWKGYFDLIASVDEFILYDDIQYTKRDWRNRNLIKTPKGIQWLTIPVKVKGKYHQKICETEIDGSEWQRSHWKALNQNYRSARYFSEIALWLEPLYSCKSFTHLSEVNRHFINAICDYLSIKTKITSSSDYQLIEGRSERLAHLCAQAAGTIYISGPAAKAYLDKKLFEVRGIQLNWFDYHGYPNYCQLWGEFIHGVTMLDLLFNCGKDAPKFLRCVR
jgi:hypothetical protein